MQRWLRILMLMMAVMTLAMPEMLWSASARCMAQTTVEHRCCPERAAITAPSCCNAKADSFLAEGRATADDMRLDVGSQIVMPSLLQTCEEVRASHELRPVYISILLPALILRT